jgi:hypothetical protein
MSFKENLERWKDRKINYLRFGILFVVYIIYLCFGAMVFSLVESPFEEDMRNDIYNARNLFKADATCISGNAF